MDRTRFLFAVHNHQPVGNFESVVAQAFEDCYHPFLERVSQHPEFRFSLHFSGPLWEYMEKKEPACWELVKLLTGRGQVELLGGGFYEPILSIIPEPDRVGQVRMMNDFIAGNFGQTPKGLWLTERVWEPQLPKSLAAAGISYTLLDEEHFHYAGVRDLHAAYITEDEGSPLTVFPIDKALRYMIPFQPLENVERYFDEIRTAGGTAILGDDGEKFGVWPGTHKWVYEDGWLDRFLAFIKEKNVEMLTFSEYLAATPPAGRVYLPPASYEEMMEWVLEPAESAVYRRFRGSVPTEARRFVRGGFFRDFFRKYPESNMLHKRMLFVSREVREAPPDETAVRELYRGQCNDPYWHGIFGGLYLPHLRESAYHHLLEAEKRVPAPAGWRKADYDLDGEDELLERGPAFHLIAKPGFGGCLAEIDYLPWSRNLTNVLSRRPESYHAAESGGHGEDGRSIHDLAKKLPPDAEDLLHYDLFPRHSLIDHFFDPRATEDDLRRGAASELGDFFGRPYEASVRSGVLRLERRGEAGGDDGGGQVTVRKTVEHDALGLRVRYEVRNHADRRRELRFGSEWNFLAFPEEFELRSGRGAALYGGRMLFETEKALALWVVPLRTLSQSEEGFDIIHQGYCLLPLWELALEAQGTLRFGVSLSVRHD